MSELKDFKKIADEIMSDINASRELKEKTLMKLRKKRNIPAGRLLAPAACFLLVLGILNISHIFPLKTQTGSENPQASIMAATAEGMATLPGRPENNTAGGAGTVKGWLPATIDEAKKDFGSLFLTPMYIPEGVKLDKIHASGSGQNAASKIILSYFAGDRSFLIIEEKTEMQYGFVDFKKVDINGAAGYLKPDASDTELHWIKDGVHYSVMGLITEDEAIKIARSMK